MEEERFALDNNNYIIDFDESCKTYCLTQEQVCEILNQQDQRIAELEEQLAEKDNENNELVFIIEEIEQFAWEQLNNENFDKYKAYDEMLTKIRQLTRHSSYEKQHQDKISFCIEQLEKVKELLFEKAIEITGTSVDSVRLYTINEIFSNQIKELKEGK